jgi:hypothetical protein
VRKGRIIAQRDKESMGGGVQAQDLGDVALNLCRMTKSLRCWSFDKFDAVTKELENIKRKIEELNDQNCGKSGRNWQIEYTYEGVAL